jgi:hypothetical protein
VLTCTWQLQRGCGNDCHIAHCGLAYACSSKRLKEDVNDGSLRGLLASHGVVAYLCGHLHGLFGQRQHLLHLGVGSGEIWFSCPCHGSGVRRRRRHALASSGCSTLWLFHPWPLLLAPLCLAAHLKGAKESQAPLRCITNTYNAWDGSKWQAHRSRHVAGHLAELESTAWKDDRRFRVLVADAGALSFADLYLNTPTKVGSQ